MSAHKNLADLLAKGDDNLSLRDVTIASAKAILDLADQQAEILRRLDNPDLWKMERDRTSLDALPPQQQGNAPENNMFGYPQPDGSIVWLSQK